MRRGVYNKGIQEAIDKFYATAEKLSGWMGDVPTDQEPYPIYNWTAPKEMIIHQATIADYKNPLHRDEEYAKRTRWGGLIAAPFFPFCIAGGMSFNILDIDPKYGSVRAQQMGEGFEEMGAPVRPGDSFKIWTEIGQIIDLTPDGEQEELILEAKDRFRIYNQKDELVCVFVRILIYEIGEPGWSTDEYMRIESRAFTGKDVRFTEEKCYSMDEINAIEKFYFDEKRQGKTIRYWEDVQVGDELFPMELGPITPWETIQTMATFGCVPAPVWHIKERTPTRVFYDPKTNIPHKNIEFHLDPTFPKKIGIPSFYSTTLIQNSIFDFFGRLMSNWMGDDGHIRAMQWMKFTNTPFGDTVFGHGKVVRKYIDEEGRCLVDVDNWMENARGFISNTGFGTIELLSRTKMNTGKLPEDKGEPRPDPNPLGFKAGDRVRVKPVKDWPLPTPHPTENATGTIIQLMTHPDLLNYCFMVFDEDITGLDPRICVGMRLDQLDKI